MTWLKRLVAVLALLVFLVAAGGMLAWREYEAMVTRPLDPDGQAVVVAIPGGSSGRQIGVLLERERLISRADLFRIELRLRPDPRPLRSGEYRLSPAMSIRELLEALRSGRTLLHSLTVPEGTDLFVLHELLRGKGEVLGGLGDYNALVWSGALPGRLGLALPSAEGVLFPDTYLLERGQPVERLLAEMVSHFERQWTGLLAEYGLPEGLSAETVLSIASLVEREARLPEERALVASVYHNRLRIQMPMQADPTTIYSMKLLGIWTGNIRKVDLQREHPYNTYAVRGLPPGPICSPGRASLAAALRPAETKYLYFVARNDGSHVFSESYEEHVRQVRKYQQGR